MMRAPILLLLAATAITAQQSTQLTTAIQPSIRLLRTPPPGFAGPRARVESEAETEFLTTDPAVFCLLTYTGGHRDDKLRVEWRNPAGALVQQNDHTQVADIAPPRVVWRLLIAGGPASLAPGDWQVHLFWNDQSIAVTRFRISAPPESVVNIASRSLLPEGTVSVPYFYQLTARGGKPPYRWLATKPFPSDLTLSLDAGTITGTPGSRGSYRVIVELRDSAGNSVTRTFGLGVGGPVARDVRAATRNLLKSSEPDPCSQTASVTEFSGDDANAVLAVKLQAPRGREGRVEWLNPRGEIFQASRVTKAAELQECIAKTLPLAGHRAAQMPGEWRVRLFWSDLEVFTVRFTVNAARVTANLPPPARSGRVAILIGNQRYEKLPAGSANSSGLDALASALRQDAFDVVRVSDANLDHLRLIENTLDEKLQPGDTALIYYAGYDSRSGGDDWLLPVNFDPSDSRPMQARAYSALRLLQWLEDSKAALKFVFLDGAAPAGQPSENPGAVLGEVDDSTALVYSRSPAPGISARALAELFAKPDLDARTALAIELPKSVTPAPVAVLGGGADFVFHK